MKEDKNKIKIKLENLALNPLEQVDKKYGKLRPYQSGNKIGGFFSEAIDAIVEVVLPKK